MPSSSSEVSVNKKLSGQLAQMSNSTSEKMITSNSQQTSSKKFSDSKSTPNITNLVPNAHQGGVNANNYNAQHHKQVEQQQIPAKKRSQQEQK